MAAVLLVEDALAIVELVRANLLVRDYSVIVSRTGENVLDLVRDNAPEIMLLDLMLPGVDGFDLCRDVRAASSTGIIVVSARRGEQDKVKALNLGADDYLTKPFGVDELLARVTALLRRSRPATRAAQAQVRDGGRRPRRPARDQGGPARPPHAHRVRAAPRAGPGAGQAP